MGALCDQCNAGADYFGSPPSCSLCTSAGYCNNNAVGTSVISGGAACQCNCQAAFGGTFCDSCADGHINYPSCAKCDAAAACNGHGMVTSDSTKTSCVCTCNAYWSGAACDSCTDAKFDPDANCAQCLGERINHPTCTQCEMERGGSADSVSSLKCAANVRQGGGLAATEAPPAAHFHSPCISHRAACDGEEEKPGYRGIGEAATAQQNAWGSEREGFEEWGGGHQATLQSESQITPRGSTVLHGAPRCSTVFHSVPRVSTGVNGSARVSRGSPQGLRGVSAGSPRVSTDLYGSPQVSGVSAGLRGSTRGLRGVSAGSPRGSAGVRVTPPGSTWLRVAPRGSTRLHAAPRDSARLRVAPRDSTCLRVALRGSASLWKDPMGLHGITRRSTAFLQVPRISRDLRRTPQSLRYLPGSPTNSRVLRGVPWYLNGSPRGPRVSPRSLARLPRVSFTLSASPMGS
eukprot:gene17157-biopygen13652